MKSKEADTFWITNISNRDVSLYDLNLTVRAYSTINLLDTHYKLNKEDLLKSAREGSIYKKSGFIKVRKVPPYEGLANKKLLLEEQVVLPRKVTPGIIAIQPVYEELNISDEQFAEESLKILEEESTHTPKKVKNV